MTLVIEDLRILMGKWVRVMLAMEGNSMEGVCVGIMQTDPKFPTPPFGLSTSHIWIWQGGRSPSSINLEMVKEIQILKDGPEEWSKCSDEFLAIALVKERKYKNEKDAMKDIKKLRKLESEMERIKDATPTK